MMKKKLIPSLLMIMICAGMIFIVKGIQEKAAAVPQAAVQAAQKADAASETKDQVSDAAPASAPSSAPAGSTAAAKQKTSGSTVKADASSSDSSAKEVSDGNTVSAASGSTAAAQTEKKPSVTFAVYDTVSGTCLTSKTVDIADGDTAADVTMKALDGDYRAAGSGESIYFSKIMGIAEKSAGPLSGWCFYVNGGKPGISSGAYKVQAGDAVEWKFLKDGTNN